MNKNEHVDKLNSSGNRINKPQFEICPECKNISVLDNKCLVPDCNSEWIYKEIKQPETKIYNILRNDVNKPNIHYGCKYIETKHDINDALGETISEKNESLYLRLIELRNMLGREIYNFYCSKAWWNDFWQHMESPYFLHIEKPPINTPKGTKVGLIHECKPVYVNSCGKSKYWVSVECPFGIGHVIIENFVG